MSQNVSFESVKRNKPLARLLVLAKREKVKNEFRELRDMLKREIPSQLPASVQQLAEHFCSDAMINSWPLKPEDIQMFIYDQVLKGQYRLVTSGDKQLQPRESIPMTAIVELLATAT